MVCKCASRLCVRNLPGPMSATSVLRALPTKCLLSCNVLLCNAELSFDVAIRMYLDSFRLPGEAQKINRIMESFGARYHLQCPAHFRNPDVVYILAYSTIMLNTNQKKSQVQHHTNAPTDFCVTVYTAPPPPPSLPTPNDLQLFKTHRPIALVKGHF